MVTHYDPSDLIDFVDAGPSTSTHNSQTDSGVNPVISEYKSYTVIFIQSNHYRCIFNYFKFQNLDIVWHVSPQ